MDNFLEDDEDEANHGQIMQARQNRQSNQLGPNPAQIEVLLCFEFFLKIFEGKKDQKIWTNVESKGRRIQVYKYKKNWLNVQCTLFRQKKNHLELISNMTKYQMVFLKLETTLTIIGLRLKQK